MVNIKEDKLGDYKVVVTTNKKPTTIQYLCRCPYCRKLHLFTGSKTTRRKTLINKKSIKCFICDNYVNWRDNVESIGYYYEMKKLLEQFEGSL